MILKIESYLQFLFSLSFGKYLIMNSFNYSIAIRTLGRNPDVLYRELQSIWKQSILPQKVVIYIAEGYKKPDFNVGGEIYVTVRKRMVAQRALKYSEIETDLLFLLDDDVELYDDCANRMIQILFDYHADCVGADVFANHSLPFNSKIYAAVTNLVIPHCDDGWADRIRINGTLAYTNTVSSDVMPTQTVGGPCSLWKKHALLAIHWEDELWMDSLAEFAYGDDFIESYKLFVNGGSLFMDMNPRVINLDAQTSSDVYRKSTKRFYTRSIMTFCNWWRAVFSMQKGRIPQIKCLFAFLFRVIWLFFVNLFAGLFFLDFRVPFFYVKGILDGYFFVHSKKYTAIPDFKIISR